MKEDKLVLGEGRGFQTKRDLAVEALRDAILRGKYRPGERLFQDQIARELGLSATPVREALRELEAQGVLVHESHKGVRVAEFKLSDLEELYPIRSLLEGYAAQLAVANLTPNDLQKLERLQARMRHALERKNLTSLREADGEFHTTICRAAKNRRLLTLITQLWASFPRYALWLIPGRAENSMKEHKRILEAAQRRDADLIAKEVRSHLESGLRAIRGYISSGEGSPFGLRGMTEEGPRG